MIYFKRRIFSILVLILFLNACGYKLGGLEVIGENSSKTAVLKISSSKELIRKFVNSGFIIDDDSYEFHVKAEGPFRKKETSSVSSSAYEREFTLTVTMKISVFNKSGESIIVEREVSKSRDYSFSSNNINSAESEERIVFSEMEKILHVEIINVIRSLI
tara:strand:+ start:70 stop:549 length:480 start_codon:yes stop_codon:yes gene_type:complete